MHRIAPKPPIATEGPVIRNSIVPRHLQEPITGTDSLFVLAHTAIPAISADDWSLELCGLVRKSRRFSLAELSRYPQRDVETIHKCAGNPFNPTEPSRQIANVIWRGVDLRLLLDDAGVDPAATHLWGYGLDYGDFFGHEVTHYVKDLPMSRVAEGDVLIAHELNGRALSPEHGYPARLVVPGFYGTNCVKWICRLEVADRRAEGPFTTELYNDPVEDGGTQPVWEIAPESLFVRPEPDATLDTGRQELWGRAWSSTDIVSVEVSFDGGAIWHEADLTARKGYEWQTFSISWRPPAPGNYRLQCRATNASGDTQPAIGARNSVYSVDVIVERRDP